MEPFIRAVLSNLIGDDAKDIDIISNSVDVKPDGSWSIHYRHPTRYARFRLGPWGGCTWFIPFRLRSGFGHDKSQAILPYRQLPDPPTLFFFGDGVSGTHPFPPLLFRKKNE